MGTDCSGLRLRMASSFLFAVRGKTSSAELGVDLGIKVHLYTRRICEENVPRDGYGSTCFAPCTDRFDVGFCFVFDMVQYRRRGWR